MSVYKIPPLKANEGHRAQDWGDLAKPLWKGRLRIIEKSSTGVALMLEDPNTGVCKILSIMTNNTKGTQANVSINRRLYTHAFMKANSIREGVLRSRETQY